MDTLSQILSRYPGTDKNTFATLGTGHTYGATYERLFAPFRESATSILELGFNTGDSLRAWRDYFEKAFIVGIDNNPDIKYFEQGRIAAWNCDAGNESQLKHVINSFGYFDIIIDDASHKPDDQFASFATLWNYVKLGGLYIIEDLQGIEFAEMWRGHGGGEIIDLRSERPYAAGVINDNVVVVVRKA